MKVGSSSSSWLLLLLLVSFNTQETLVDAFSTAFSIQKPSVSNSQRNRHIQLLQRWGSSSGNNKEWTSDFDDFVGDDFGPIGDVGGTKSDEPLKYDDDDEGEVKEDSSSSGVTFDLTKLLKERPPDYTAIQTRQFSLGPDLVLDQFIGNMGFDEVTDWEYYYPEEDDDDESPGSTGTRRRRQVVQPNPFDEATPQRTRTSSGSVVRVFRGEFVGQLGGTIRAQGLDARVLIKEFTGKLALQLASQELESTAQLQSDLVQRAGRDDALEGAWQTSAAARATVSTRQDNAHVVQLVKLLGEKAPFLGILGEVNLAELEGNMDPNEFYRAMKVAPPKPEAIWVVYEYAGLSTLQAYAEPAAVRRSKLPLKRGFFGSVVEPPSLPAWKQRANYVVNGILRGAIEAVAYLHESGVVHRSIGKTSLLLSSKAMDKTEAANPYTTSTSQLRIKLADFGFSGMQKQATADEEFCTRARSFGFAFRPGETSIATTNFAIAEDMHALGFVALALLLSSLAELPDPTYQMPATDEDTLQRLFGEIFDKDMDQFREYVEAEEIWSDLVTLLDEKDGAGWKVLETLLLAREKAAKNKETSQIFTVRGLLSNPFFKTN